MSSSPRMRPRFVIEVACETSDVMTVLRDRIEDNPQRVEGKFSERHGVIKIPDDQRHFWSPQLGLTIKDADSIGAREEADGEELPTRVFGIFQPHPEVWTAFVFIIGTLVTCGIFGTMYGIVELSLGRTPWALLAPVVTAVLGVLVYLATLVGQGLGAAEMYRQRAFLDDCIDQAEEIARRRPRTARDSAQL